MESEFATKQYVWRHTRHGSGPVGGRGGVAADKLVIRITPPPSTNALSASPVIFVNKVDGSRKIRRRVNAFS